MKKFSIFIALVAIFGAAVFFAKTSGSTKQETASMSSTATATASAPLAAAGEVYEVDLSPEEAKALQQVSSRTPADVEGQQRIVNQMNQIILNVKSRGEVVAAAAKIVELAKQDANSQMPGVQIYKAVASLVPSLEGLVYRCREFVEPSDWLHMTALFNLRDFSYNDYLYGPHIKALFDFVTYPSERVGKPFKSVSEFQNFGLNEIAPKLLLFSQLLVKLDALPSQNFEFQFDRTILVGRGPNLRFLDPSEAKKLFIKPNLYTLNFLVQRALGSIYYIGAMDLNEMPVVFNRVIRQTTINTFAGDLRLSTPAKGVTPQMTYEIIKKTKSFLGWRNDLVLAGQKVSAQQLLDRSYKHALNAAYLQLGAYVCNVKYPAARTRGQNLDLQLKRDCMTFEQESNPESYFVANGSKYIFNPNSMILNFKEKYHMFRDRLRLYGAGNHNESAAVTSDVTGQTINVNLHAFFNAAHSQREFLPTGYAAGSPSSSAAGLGVTAWNYNYGKPMTFNDYTFGGFFDQKDVRDSASLYRAMTTVLYTKSIAPFAIFIRVPSTVRFFVPPSELIGN